MKQIANNSMHLLLLKMDTILKRGGFLSKFIIRFYTEPIFMGTTLSLKYFLLNIFIVFW